MSTPTALTKQNIGTKIQEVRERFTTVISLSSDTSLNFEKEQGFAIQALNNNETLMNAALYSPASLINSVLNVALTGLSLNPVLKFAYLIPRKQKVILEPSYIGMIKILTDAGIVKSIRAEIVRESDEYYIELGTKPFIKHSPNLRAERRDIVGVYAIAELEDGLQQMEVMSKYEVDAIMGRSESAKSNSSPWKSDYSEMARKTVIRRIYKYLPKSKLKSVDILQAFEDNDFDDSAEISNVPNVFSNNVVDKPVQAQVVQQPIPQQQVQQPIDEAVIVTVVPDDDKEFEVQATVQVWREQIEALQDTESVQKMSATIQALRDDVRVKLLPIFNEHLKKLRIEQTNGSYKKAEAGATKDTNNNSTQKIDYGF